MKTGMHRLHQAILTPLYKKHNISICSSCQTCTLVHHIPARQDDLEQMYLAVSVCASSKALLLAVAQGGGRFGYALLKTLVSDCLHLHLAAEL